MCYITGMLKDRSYWGPINPPITTINWTRPRNNTLKALENGQRQAESGRNLILGIENGIFTALSLRECHNPGPRTLGDNQQSFWLQEPESSGQARSLQNDQESWKGENQRREPQSLDIISAQISSWL